MSATATRTLAKMSDEELVDFVLEGLSEASAQSYRYDLDHFAKYRRASSAGAALRALAALSLPAGNEVVAEFLRQCERDGDSGNTLNRRLNALKSSIRRIGEEYSIDLVITIKRGRAETVRDLKGPGPKVWERMLAQAKAEAESARKTYTGRRFVRDRAILHLAGERGLKRLAVASLDYPADVRLASAKLRVAGRWIDISPAACDALRDWIEVRGHWPGALFTRQDKAHARNEPARIEPRVVNDAVKALARRAGITGRVTAGQLRNAAKSRGIQSGWSVRELQEFTGNKSVDADLVQAKGRKPISVDKPIHRRRSNGPKGCPVKLRAPGAPFYVVARMPDGRFRLKKKAAPDTAQYKLLDYLVNVYPGTVTYRELRKVCGDGPDVYKRYTKSDPDLKAAMRDDSFGLIDPREQR